MRRPRDRGQFDPLSGGAGSLTGSFHGSFLYAEAAHAKVAMFVGDHAEADPSAQAVDAVATTAAHAVPRFEHTDRLRGRPRDPRPRLVAIRSSGL